MTPLFAHPGHWLAQLLYLAPVLLLFHREYVMAATASNATTPREMPSLNTRRLRCDAASSFAFASARPASTALTARFCIGA